MEFRYGDFDGVPHPQFCPNSVRSSFPPFQTPPPPPPNHDGYFPPLDATAYEPYDYRYFSSRERMLEYRPRSEEPPSGHNLVVPYRPSRDPFMDWEYERERIREEVLREEVYRRYIEEEVRRRIIKEEVRRELEMEHHYGVRYFNLGYQGAQAQPTVQFEQPRVSYGCYVNGPRSQAPLDRFKGRRNIKNVMHKIVEISEDELTAKLPVGGEKVQTSNEEEIQKRKDKATVRTEENGNKVESITDMIVLKKAKKRKIERRKRICTLCRAAIYSERDWLCHLNGNRHSNKLKSLEMSKKTSSDADNRRTSGIGLEAVKIEMDNGDSADGNPTGKQPQTDVRLRKIQVGREVHEVVEKNNRLWCEECQYNCTTTVMMTIHLAGERHKVNCQKL